MQSSLHTLAAEVVTQEDLVLLEEAAELLGAALKAPAIVARVVPVATWDAGRVQWRRRRVQTSPQDQM